MDMNAVGRTGSPITMRIEAGKIREFAAAVKDKNPIYYEEAYARAEAGGILPPPTFTMTSAFWGDETSRPELNMDMRRILHGGQEFEFVKPVYAGDVLTAQTRISDMYTKPGKRGGEMTFAIEETTFKNQNGEVVLFSRSTIIETAKPVEKKD